MEPPMPRPTITAVNILEKRRREDGGADLLVQVTLKNGVVHWLAVRKADATLTATRTVEGHSRRLVTVPARRTLKAGLADLLAEWPGILHQNRGDAIGDHWELHRDDFDRREHRRRLDREWRVDELALVDAEDRSRRQTVCLARLSCTRASADSDDATQFVLELGPGFDGRLRCGALGPGHSVDVAVDVERLRSAVAAEAVEPAALACHVDENDAGKPRNEASIPLCHVDGKPTQRGRPPKYHTAEERATAERQRKVAWARARRQGGYLKETAESLRERQRRRRARLKASSKG
jgi:hypothetical protein